MSSSQLAQENTKNRAKNYSKIESDSLLKICDEFHLVINRNSNRDVDKQEKVKAWQKIKKRLDEFCQSEGIYVSHFNSSKYFQQ